MRSKPYIDSNPHELTEAEQLRRDRWERQNRRDHAECWLKRTVAAYRLLDEEWDRLRRLTGADSDSALGSAVWEPITLLIEAVSERLGDDNGILDWFVWENDCGLKNFGHSLPDGTMRDVSTLDDLLDVMGFQVETTATDSKRV